LAAFVLGVCAFSVGALRDQLLLMSLGTGVMASVGLAESLYLTRREPKDDELKHLSDESERA
jgi:hypothetical protein